MKDMYQITLTGQGDTTIAFVDKAVFDWINSAPPANAASDGSWNEKVPGGDGEDVCVTIGSYDNDRALHACYGGETFDTPSQARAWVKRNDINVVDDYIGYIY